MNHTGSDWPESRAELSIGLEVECFLPDVAKLSTQIPVIDSKEAHPPTLLLPEYAC